MANSDLVQIKINDACSFFSSFNQLFDVIKGENIRIDSPHLLGMLLAVYRESNIINQSINTGWKWRLTVHFIQVSVIVVVISCDVGFV